MRSHYRGLSFHDTRRTTELTGVLDYPEDQADVIKATLSVDGTNYAADRVSKL